jgi:PAS domain S-box-containing protein
LEAERTAQRARHTSELWQSQEHFRLMVESVQDYGIFMLDREGRVVSWNAGAERIKGYRAEEILGRHFSTFYPQEDIERGKPAQELKIAAAEGRLEDEGWRVRKDGSRFWANVVITALRDPSGNLRGFAKVTRDMSERKQTEEAIHKLNHDLATHAAQLEAINRELEAFSYSVAHDLRAPLRSIGGFSQALLEDYAANLDATGQDYIQRMQQAIRRMGDMIDGLLALSRLTRGELHYTLVDLSALARTIAADMQQTQPDRTVEWLIAAELVARGDARLLRVVLENLLGNAWKFTARRPNARIEVGSLPPDDAARVYFVRDNGVGFDMAYADKLFGTFQRLHTLGEFAGTGIGLATVQRIIHRHGGRVWAEAALDQGATFYFSL